MGYVLLGERVLLVQYFRYEGRVILPSDKTLRINFINFAHQKNGEWLNN